MRRVLLGLLLPALVLLSAPPTDAADAPTSRREPHIGYAYPAGAQAGTTTEILVGGQYIRNLKNAYVSGDGVKASVVMYIPPSRNLDGSQRRLLQQRLRDARGKAQQTTPGPGGKKRGKGKAKKEKTDAKANEVKLPDHPLLESLGSRTVDQLREIARFFFVREHPLQRKRAIAEMAVVRIEVAADAVPGKRELRIETGQGVSNPIQFRVGVLPEVREREPFPVAALDLGTATAPCVLNGQILPKDVDRFRIQLQKGQRLVFQAEARGLVPYQADSVPGWMQATLTLFDPDGTEVGYADEWRYDPDPVLYYEVPEDGTYELEVRDAVMRGRKDFVYRVSIGETPFISRIFPLGGRQGTLVQATIDGFNLTWPRVPLDTREGEGGLREMAWRLGEGVTNDVTYAVDSLPESVEAEPNDGRDAAQAVEIPHVVNGRIDKAGDVDVYRVEGKKGQQLVVEVTARVLGSPIDSVIRVKDASGEVVAWNDDYVPKGLTLRGLGLQTHHADSYLMTKLKKSGTYTVHVADVTNHGSASHAYRLRIGPPRPSVDLYVTPSTINIPVGRAALVSVHAIRKDGFEGEVDIELQGEDHGFQIGGGHIPAGNDRTWMTLTAPPGGRKRPVPLKVVGRTTLGREKAVLPVRPADDIMQAFLWRHLVPAQDLVVAVQGKGGNWIPKVELARDDPVRVPRGGKGRAELRLTGRVPVKDFHFELIAPPKGISLGRVKADGRGFSLEIKATKDVVRTGREVNLIIEAFAQRGAAAKKGKKKNKKKDKTAKVAARRYSVGLLPAIPILVTR